jgi:hypothetical protein
MRKWEVRSRKLRMKLFTSYFSFLNSLNAVVCALPISSCPLLMPYSTTTNPPFGFETRNSTQAVAGGYKRAKTRFFSGERKSFVSIQLRPWAKFVVISHNAGTFFV